MFDPGLDAAAFSVEWRDALWATGLILIRGRAETITGAVATADLLQGLFERAANLRPAVMQQT